MNLVSIRGAITVEDNSEKSILEGTSELLRTIEDKNDLLKDKVISMLFSATKELDQAYPAKAARDMGYVNCGLMCFSEMVVKGSLEKCIRVMILYSSDVEQNNVQHVYLKDAIRLRPDLAT